MKSCIKKDVYIFLFYFLCLSCSHSSCSLRHPSLVLHTSSFTLQLRAQPFPQGRRSFFRALHIGKLISLYPASSLFETQQQLSQEDARFPGRCTLAYNFYFVLCYLSMALSNSSLILW